jgi:hypothetical protein
MKKIMVFFIAMTSVALHGEGAIVGGFDAQVLESPQVFRHEAMQVDGAKKHWWKASRYKQLLSEFTWKWKKKDTAMVAAPGAAVTVAAGAVLGIGAPAILIGGAATAGGYAWVKKKYKNPRFMFNAWKVTRYKRAIKRLMDHWDSFTDEQRSYLLESLRRYAFITDSKDEVSGFMRSKMKKGLLADPFNAQRLIYSTTLNGKSLSPRRGSGRTITDLIEFLDSKKEIQMKELFAQRVKKYEADVLPQLYSVEG